MDLIQKSGLGHIMIIVFSNATPTSDHYTLSLHDALPISSELCVLRIHGLHKTYGSVNICTSKFYVYRGCRCFDVHILTRSEEHTSELQSRGHLVCRLLLEKKK